MEHALGHTLAAFIIKKRTPLLAVFSVIIVVMVRTATVVVVVVTWMATESRVRLVGGGVQGAFAFQLGPADKLFSYWPEGHPLKLYVDLRDQFLL